MACLGVLFALTEADVAQLRALDEDDRVEHVSEVIEERELGGEWAVETDKAWDAIHRCFCGGELDWEAGEYPLNHIILAGEPLYTGDDYVLSLKTPEQVRDVAARIGGVTQKQLIARYNKIDPKKYGFPLDDNDREYTWENFTGLVGFYQKAAEAGRYVLFTVDQ